MPGTIVYIVYHLSIYIYIYICWDSVDLELTSLDNFQLLAHVIFIPSLSPRYPR